MTQQNPPRPLVPSRLPAHHQDGNGASRQAGGAKNLWVRTGHLWKLNIGTYNVRSLRTDDRLMELDTELDNVKWDVVGISEVRRKGTELMTLKSGNLFYHSGSNVSQAGVGFMVNKALAGNVIEFKGISDRICLVAIRLNEKCQVNIIQVYAPTSSYDDEVVENFYSQVSTTIEMCKGNN